MHRFYVPSAEPGSDRISLTGPEAHHAIKVLRLKSGNEAVILNGRGARLSCRIEALSKVEATLTVIKADTIPAPAAKITLFQAVPKGKLIESIIQKATELGVFRIIPVITERVVGVVSAPDAPRKMSKWQGVAVEAIKQCGAAWLPLVEAPRTLKQILSQRESFDLPLIASLGEGAQVARGYFDRFVGERHRLPASICIWVGPEGDFTRHELSAIQKSGALPITLGPLVLRVETAAIYCLSILNYELQSRGAQNRA